MNNSLRPFERSGCLVVGDDKSIDRAPDLLRRGEANAPEGLLLEDAEPNPDLIHPGGVGWREVKFHQGMLPQPAIVFRLVGVQIVQNHGGGAYSGRL